MPYANLLILGGIGVLITVAWTAIADDGASGSGRGHANPARGGLEHPMRHGGSHSSLIWQFGMGLLTREETYPREEAPTPVPTIPPGGLVVVGTEHMIAGHLLAELSILQHIHVQAEARHAHVAIPQAVAPSSAEPDQGRRRRRRSHCQPIAGSSARCRWARSAGVWAVWPRVTRPRTTGKFSLTMGRDLSAAKAGRSFPRFWSNGP